MDGTRRARRRHAARNGAAIIAFALALIVALPNAAFASVSATPDTTAGVTGTVYALAQVGDRTIIGGNFTAVGGVARRNVAAIRADGTVDPGFNPNVDGIVYAVAGNADGSRIFIGGAFATVGGVARARIAAVDPSGAVVPTWQANANDEVRALATSGTRVYAGGRFTTIGPSSRPRLAAIDTATGTVITAFNPRPSWTVRAVTVSPDGTKVYAVGSFSAIGGQARKYAAEVLASNGQATAFAPTRDGGIALAVALTPNGSRVFYSTENNRLFAYDPAISNNPVYVVATSGDTQAIGASATEVYIGGHFSQLQNFKLKRAHIASFRVADGTPTTWNPTINGALGVWAIGVTPNAVVVGGDFTQVGNKNQPGFARFSGTP
jgi:Domain of unknown function (DUF5122) beta-propeller